MTNSQKTFCVKAFVVCSLTFPLKGFLALNEPGQVASSLVLLHFSSTLKSIHLWVFQLACSFSCAFCFLLFLKIFYTLNISNLSMYAFLKSVVGLGICS